MEEKIKALKITENRDFSPLKTQGEIKYKEHSDNMNH